MAIKEQLNGVPSGRIAGVPGPEKLTIPRLNRVLLTVPVVGITPLIICRFHEKARRIIEDGDKPTNKKSKSKDAVAEFNAGRHVSADGWDGLHAGSVRAAMISAARSVDGLTMTSLKQAVFVRADGCGADDGVPLIRILGAEPEMFTNMCRTATQVAYPRSRPIYRDWRAVFRVELNTHILRPDAALNLLAIAGFSCGVGEWRPSAPKSMTGDYGRFEIDPAGQLSVEDL